MAISEFHLPINHSPFLPLSSPKPPLDLVLAGQPLALNCTFSLARSKPVIHSFDSAGEFKGLQ